jgi:cobalt transporter subunit CbtA
VWGAAGFAIFTLAPAAGLPPELPGMEAAELGARQIWWGGASLAAALGLGLIAFWPGALAKVLAAALIVAPHVIGAPHPGEAAGKVPPELAAQFVTASLVTAALFWLVLGATGGWLFQKLGEREQRNANIPAG